MLPTCYRLISDTANKSATSCFNGIWETTRHTFEHASLLQTYCALVVYVRGNWCNGFWPLLSEIDSYTTADKDAQQSMVIIIIVRPSHS